MGVGRTEEAESTFLRSVAVLEPLCAAHPETVGVKLGYARSLCGLHRYPEARGIVDEVLTDVPNHPQAEAVMRRIESQWSHG